MSRLSAYDLLEVRRCWVEEVNLPLELALQFLISILWLIIACVWFIWVFRTVRQVQTINPLEWRVVNKPKTDKENNEEKFKYFYVF